MAKLIVVLFAVLLVATLALAQQCAPWRSYCSEYGSCCRHLVCPSYLHRCVPKGGLVIPGHDKRPIGPGPFPPGYIA